MMTSEKLERAVKNDIRSAILRGDDLKKYMASNRFFFNTSEMNNYISEMWRIETENLKKLNEKTGMEAFVNLDKMAACVLREVEYMQEKFGFTKKDIENGCMHVIFKDGEMTLH